MASILVSVSDDMFEEVLNAFSSRFPRPVNSLGAVQIDQEGWVRAKLRDYVRDICEGERRSQIRARIVNKFRAIEKVDLDFVVEPLKQEKVLTEDGAVSAHIDEIQKVDLSDVEKEFASSKVMHEDDLNEEVSSSSKSDV